MPPLCPSPVRITGVITSAQLANLDLATLTRAIYVGGKACCCCDVPCGNVRAAVPMVGVGRLTDGVAALTPTQRVPEDMLPPSFANGIGGAAARLRYMPFVKARVAPCEPFSGTRFFDLNHSLVLPWCEGAVSLMVPQDSATQRWTRNPPLDVDIAPIAGAGNQYVVELWAWPSLRCTPCCPEPGYAILTDMLNIAAGSSVFFMVPPGAVEATVYVTASGASVTGAWMLGATVVSTWVFADGAFGSRYPHSFAVVPGVELLRVTSIAGGQPCTVAWKVRA